MGPTKFKIPPVAPAADDDDLPKALVPPAWPRPIGYANGMTAKGRVIVTATDTDNNNAVAAPAISLATGPVTDAPPTLSVTVSGTAQEGAVLTANPIVGSTLQTTNLTGPAGNMPTVQAPFERTLPSPAPDTDSPGSSVSPPIRARWYANAPYSESSTTSR